MATVYYYCPDVSVRSAGIRTIYRHVGHLVRNGLKAAVLHHEAGFRMPDVPEVPVRYIVPALSVERSDVLVFPEGYANIMQQLKDMPMRKVVFCQNWSYVFRAGTGWKGYGIERVLAFPQETAKWLEWCMGLPTHAIDAAIRSDLYFHEPKEKKPQVMLIKRKQGNAEQLVRALRCRDPAYVERIRWLPVDNLSEEDYAREVRRSTVFLNLSMFEGLQTSSLEAMRCGTLVAGFNGIGSREVFVGDGPAQNCITAENGDYATLAVRLEPVLKDILKNDMSAWQPVLQAALATAAPYTLEREERTLVELWRKLLAG